MKRNLSVLLSTIVLISSPVVAWTEEGEAPKGRIGPGKAVLEAIEANGIRLSEKAIQNLNLRFAPVAENGTVKVQATALVKFQDFLAIYRKRDGWFKMVEVEPRIQNGIAFITSKDLKVGDEVVIENSPLLRVVDLDVWGPEADACAD